MKCDMRLFFCIKMNLSFIERFINKVFNFDDKSYLSHTCCGVSHSGVESLSFAFAVAFSNSAITSLRNGCLPFGNVICGIFGLL